MYTIGQEVSQRTTKCTHIPSYNHFLSYYVPQILGLTANLDTQWEGRRYQTILRDLTYHSQGITPSEAHQMDKSYTVDVRTSYDFICTEPIDPEDPNKERLLFHVQVRDALHVGIPLMLNSELCVMQQGTHRVPEYESFPGGTFIIQGKAHEIRQGKKPRHNRITHKVIKKSSGHLLKAVEVWSEHPHRSYRSTSTFRMFVWYQPTQEKKRHTAHNLFIRMVPDQTFEKKFPVMLIFSLLGWNKNMVTTALRICLQGSLDHDHLSMNIYMLHHCEHADLDTRTCVEKIAEILGKPLEEERHYRSVESNILKELFPHLNPMAKDPEQRTFIKAWYMVNVMAHLLLWNYDLVPVTDKDHMANNRIEDGGDRITNLLHLRYKDGKNGYKKHNIDRLRDMIRSAHPNGRNNSNKKLLSGDARTQAELKSIKVDQLYDYPYLTDRLHKAVASGRWTEKRNNISQSLDVKNPLAMESQTDQVLNTINKQGKNFAPRELHPSAMGLMGSMDTPEGELCGLKSPKAIHTEISPEIDNEDLWLLCRDELERNSQFTWLPLTSESLPHVRLTDYKVFDGMGIWRGWVREGEAWVAQLRSWRRSLAIHPLVAVWLEEHVQCREIHMDCSKGRKLRPLIVRENAYKLPYFFNTEYLEQSYHLIENLQSHGILEYLDAAEMATNVYPIYYSQQRHELGPQHTHFEISDINILGKTCSYIVYSRHNPAARGVFQSNMGRQSHTEKPHADRGAPTDYFGVGNQEAHVRTQYKETMGRHTERHGRNLVVAVMTDEYAMEDAIKMNRQSLNLGMFDSFMTHTYTVSKNDPNQEICKPNTDEIRESKQASYHAIDDRGLPRIGEIVMGSDVVIGRRQKRDTSCGSPSRKRKKRKSKKSDKKEAEEQEYIDTSMCVRKGKDGRVWRIVENDEMIRVYLIKYMRLEEGDKLTNAHAQKGITGHICNREDMPFLADGTQIDILFPPMGMGTRETVGLFWELLFGKVAVATGDLKYGLDPQNYTRDPKDPNYLLRRQKKMEDILLRSFGESKHGVWVYDGITGEPLETRVFMGILYYEKLYHMVAPKSHGRAEGPMQTTNRQPIEGRVRDGGIRFGEMTIASQGSHGTDEILREKTMTCADKFTAYICRQCGHMGYGNTELSLYHCHYCGHHKHIYQVDIPFGARVMFVELACNNFMVKFHIQPQEIDWDPSV